LQNKLRSNTQDAIISVFYTMPSMKNNMSSTNKLFFMNFKDFLVWTTKGGK
jgi:hypothetical protein